MRLYSIIFNVLNSYLKEFSFSQKNELASLIEHSLDSDYKKKMQVERHKIELDKWFEGERRNSDPGESYILSWINEKGSLFHEEFSSSDCRTCQKSNVCNDVCKFDCSNYIPDLTDREKHLMRKLLSLLAHANILIEGYDDKIKEIEKKFELLGK